MVAPRYDSSHPEGFVDHRYPDLKGNLGQESNEGGPGSGPQKGGTDREIHNLQRSLDMVRDPSGRKVLKQKVKALGDKVRAEHGAALSDRESRRPGWTGRQKDMHKDIGQQIARESRGGSRKEGPVQLGPNDGEPDHPIDLRSISTQAPVREGWHGGMSYSPPVTKLKQATESKTGVVVKEF